MHPHSYVFLKFSSGNFTTNINKTQKLQIGDVISQCAEDTEKLLYQPATPAAAAEAFARARDLSTPGLSSPAAGAAGAGVTEAALARRWDERPSSSAAVTPVSAAHSLAASRQAPARLSYLAGVDDASGNAAHHVVPGSSSVPLALASATAATAAAAAAAASASAPPALSDSGSPPDGRKRRRGSLPAGQGIPSTGSTLGVNGTGNGVSLQRCASGMNTNSAGKPAKRVRVNWSTAENEVFFTTIQRFALRDEPTVLREIVAALNGSRNWVQCKGHFRNLQVVGRIRQTGEEPRRWVVVDGKGKMSGAGGNSGNGNGGGNDGNGGTGGTGHVGNVSVGSGNNGKLTSGMKVSGAMTGGAENMSGMHGMADSGNVKDGREDKTEHEDEDMATTEGGDEKSRVRSEEDAEDEDLEVEEADDGEDDEVDEEEYDGDGKHARHELADGKRGTDEGTEGVRTAGGMVDGKTGGSGSGGGSDEGNGHTEGVEDEEEGNKMDSSPNAVNEEGETMERMGRVAGFSNGMMSMPFKKQAAVSAQMPMLPTMRPKDVRDMRDKRRFMDFRATTAAATGASDATRLATVRK